jgi:hypothetical protein
MDDSTGSGRDSNAYQFQNYKQNVIDNEGPFAPIAISSNAKDDGAN